jgi:hypothetical protein
METEMSLISKDHEYVYLLEEIGPNGVPTNLVKIGHTGNSPSERAAELSTGNARKLRVYAAIKTPVGQSFNEEQRLHRVFSRYSTKPTLDGGIEWFNDDQSDIRKTFDVNINKLVDGELVDFTSLIDDIADFTSGKYRDTYSFVKNKIAPFLLKSHVLVLAPPKSGKRIMVKSCALLYPSALHIYLNAQDKNDMNVQLKEYEKYHIPAISVTNQGKQTNRVKRDMLTRVQDWDGLIIVHFDECDFGSSDQGKLNKFLKELEKCVNPMSHIRYVVYSATPEEALFSEADYHVAHFTPSANYNGPKWFMDNDLVYDATPFFSFDDDNFSLTDQAKSVLEDWLNTNKFISVLRLNYKIGKVSAFTIAEENRRLQTSIDQLIGAGKIVVHFYDQNRPFEWYFFDETSQSYGSWNNFNASVKHLLVISGLCTRGTEVGFHPMIFAWHDWRKAESGSTTYGTYAQAMGRNFHYNSDYVNPERKVKFNSSDTKIRLYTEKSLCQIMEKVYSSTNKDEMRKVWDEYTSRDVSARTHREEASKFEYQAFDTVESARESYKQELKDHNEWDELEWDGNWKFPNHCSSFKSKNLIETIRKGQLPPARGSRIIHLDGPCPRFQKWIDDYNNYVAEHPNHKGKFLLAVRTNEIAEIKPKGTIHNILSIAS